MPPPLLQLSKKRTFETISNVLNTTTETKQEEHSVIAPKENTFLKKRKQFAQEEEDQIDYDTVSISHFGAAYLKGYGWKEGKGFGRTEDKIIEPVSVEVRPKLSGLGSLSTVSNDNNTITTPIAKEQSLENAYLKHSIFHDKLTTNHLVKIINGSYEGLFGRVVEVLSNHKYKLLLQDYSTVLVKESDLEMITDLSKYNTEHSIRIFAQTQEYIPSHHVHTNHRITDWLLPNIRVRITSKQKYYNTKGVILDVPEKHYATIQLDNSNTIIDRIHENDLETIVPKHCPCKVMIVNGKYKGTVATCLHKTSQQCHVQLTQQIIIELEYDEIAQVAS